MFVKSKHGMVGAQKEQETGHGIRLRERAYCMFHLLLRTPWTKRLKKEGYILVAQYTFQYLEIARRSSKVGSFVTLHK